MGFISFSRIYSRSRDRTHVSWIGMQILYHWGTWEVLVIYGHNQISMLELGICWYWSAWISALELNVEFSPLFRNCGTSFYSQCMSFPLVEPQVDPLHCGSSHVWTQLPGGLSVSYWRLSTICEQGARRGHFVSPEPSPVHKHNMLSESFI